MAGSLKKALSLFRREGMAGIKRGLGVREPDHLHYDEWVRRYDTLTDKSRGIMRERMGAFPYKPLISVIVPTYNPKGEWLVEAIESVRQQLYPHWELCIADDASTDPTIRIILERYASMDERIKVMYREKNGHISAASNSALELADGEWVALLDHDDVLSEHALFWVADALNYNADICLIYSDEDTLDEQGRRSNPNFKCDWNEDLFYSQNMICHLALYRTELLKAIGGFREGLEGSQDYDIALRYVETIKSWQIHHIPRVLYHWRIHATSTALSPTVKPYALQAGERALNEHFKRKRIAATATHIGYSYRARYALPDTLPRMTLIIMAGGELRALQRCITSLLGQTGYADFEMIVSLKHSANTALLGYVEGLSSEGVRSVRNNDAVSFAQRVNAAARLAHGELLGMISDHVEATSADWLSEMVSHAMRPDVGAVGARLWYPDHRLYHGGMVLGIKGVAGHAHRHLPSYRSGHHARAILQQNFSAVSGECLVVRKSIFEEVGGYDETNVAERYSDIDFCLRVGTAGYRNVWTPYAELYYHQPDSNNIKDILENQAQLAKEVQYMTQRWKDKLQHDPAYNPNLTLEAEDFSYAWPPRLEILEVAA